MVNLYEKAKIIRRQILELSYEKQMGHLGGTFSCIELLISLYYGGIFNFHLGTRDKNRDRFILSKGHACLALYSILFDQGVISDNDLFSYCSDGGLGAQLDTSVPGIDWNTGSLGHSIGICCGFALAARMDGSQRRSCTLIGDAECSEGSIWESLVYAGENHLNIIVIVDRNRLSVTEVLDNDSFFRKELFHNFGWDFYDINGHEFDQILPTLKMCATNKPSIIIANTIKGKGISFMENKIEWHHGNITEEQYKLAMSELQIT